MNAKSTTVELLSGHQMPLVGYGLWKVPKDVCADTVCEAIKLGYRLFDGAYDYQNESEAGQGIQRAIKEGLVKREEVFVTTKLWNNYHQKDVAKKMIKSQVEAWGLGYIDLFLIHFPVSLKYIDPETLKYPCFWMDKEQTKVEFENSPLSGAWEALEWAVDEGLVKSIGLSNVQAQSILEVANYAKKPISNVQLEHHPYLVQPRLIGLAQHLGIAVTAYSSFGPMSYRELGNQAGEILFEHKTIAGIAQKHSKTPAQILLKWATQRGVAVIPKSNSVERLKQNLEVTQAFDLSEDEIKQISALDCNLRFNDPIAFHPRLAIFA